MIHSQPLMTQTPPIPPNNLSLFQTLQRWDETVIRAVAQLRPTSEKNALNRLMTTLTRIGDWDSWTVILILFVVLGGPFREAARMTIPSIMSAFLISHLLKRWVKRPRPSVKMPDLTRLLGNPDQFSFPSAHSACAWAGCLGLATGFPELKPLILLLATGISWSRLHVGAHYLTDILAGIALGIACSTGIPGFFITL